MAPRPETGYFVLSDFSGFTAYLAGVELDHAQSVLRDLTELLIARLAPPLTVAGLVGDGVLAYARVRQLPRGETLLELVEAAYGAFRERVSTIARRTTCPCRACRAIPELDLKFLIHSGEFVLQTLPAASPQAELLGLDVDLVRQRWLKLPVSAVTGWRGYALFTGAALKQMGLHPDRLDAHRQVVSVGAAGGPTGDVVTYSLDLKARYDDRLAARQAFISAGEADAVVVQDLPAPPAVVWEWLNDPLQRTRWMRGRVWRQGARPGGRTDVGARNHCEHGLGAATETVLDWRPFEYFTVELTPRSGNLTMLQTFCLEPLGAGTRVHSHTFFQRPLPRWLARPLCRLTMGATLKADLSRLAGLVAERPNN
jgi:uncharacterized protein YndB with AHSA1/START domain